MIISIDLIYCFQIFRVFQKIPVKPSKVIKFIATFAKIDTQMNVERDIAGVALPFTIGILITAYAGAIFGARFSYVQFFALLVIFCSTVLLLQRRKIDFHPHLMWTLVSTAALGCGVLSAATAISLFDMPQSWLEIHCHSLGQAMQEMIDRIPFLSEDTTALVKALLTGERADLSAYIKNAFRESGASHILALSGLHLGIIYGILSKTLSILGNSRQLKNVRSVIIILVCGIYTMSTGAGDSLVRALIFIALREVAKITCRYHGLGQILLASLVIQLAIDPLAIRSVSFQLSYAAMAGIAFIFPWLQGFWNRAADYFQTKNSNKTISRLSRIIVHPGRWIWNTVALSIACQITTAPIAYMYFETFPIHFMLTNLLTLPLTGLLIPVALITLCFSAIGCCPIFLVHITEWITGTLIGILKIISTM